MKATDGCALGLHRNWQTNYRTGVVRCGACHTPIARTCPNRGHYGCDTSCGRCGGVGIVHLDSATTPDARPRKRETTPRPPRAPARAPRPATPAGASSAVPCSLCLARPGQHCTDPITNERVPYYHRPREVRANREAARK